MSEEDFEVTELDDRDLEDAGGGLRDPDLAGCADVGCTDVGCVDTGCSDTSVE